MNQTDRISPECFFAELILPLRDALARKGIHYLKLGGEPESHWCPIASRTGGLERLSATLCGGDVLLERLLQYWTARGDDYLPKLVPYLADLRREINDAQLIGAEQRAKLGAFVYPLF